MTQEDRAFLHRCRQAMDEKLAEEAETPGKAARDMDIAREWKPGTYQLNDVRSRAGNLYRCVQAHDSTENAGWTPEAAPALCAACHATDAAYALPYVQPQGAHDAYQSGEFIVWEGAVHECVMDNCVYSPTEYAAAWQEVPENG